MALIVHLAEFDARRLHLGAGFGSLYDYCMRVLHFSEDAACNRIAAARIARKYPAVLDMLADGRLSPTTARLLKRYLTSENHVELFTAASWKSKRQVEELLAHLYPQPDVPESIRAVPPAPVVPGTKATGSALASLPLAAPVVNVGPTEDSASVSSSAPVAPPPPRPLVRPLAPERYEIRFTSSSDSLERLRLAQDMLSHSIPSGDLAQVFDRAITALLEDLARQRFAATKRPRKSRGPSDQSDHIPAEVKRTVFLRDLGRCRYVSPDGHRCESRRFIQFHHVHPRGAGGKATVENIELRCGPHNRHEAEVFYGPGKARGGTDLVGEPRTFYRANIATRSGTGERRQGPRGLKTTDYPAAPVSVRGAPLTATRSRPSALAW